MARFRRFAWIARVSLVVLLSVSLLTSCSVLKPSRTARYVLYEVRRGDTLYSIGQEFGVPAKELANVNGIDNARSISVGQVVRVPYRSGISRSPRQASIKRLSTPRASMRRAQRSSSKRAKQVRLGGAAQHVGKPAWPLKKGRFSSDFGWRWGRFHEGIDIAVASGTPIFAAHDGEVVYSGSSIRGYGNIIAIRGDRIMTVYGHNRRNRVRRGAFVKKGRHIADVGATGNATGPHLHFETRIRDGSGRNMAVDPLAFYPK